MGGSRAMEQCFRWEGALNLVDDTGNSPDAFISHPYYNATLMQALGARGGPEGAERVTCAKWPVWGTTCCDKRRE
jgi:hypothetical protein